MDKAAPHRTQSVGTSGLRRRVAIAMLGVLALGAYALADSIEWGSAPALQPMIAPAPASVPVRAAARDLALTTADVTRISPDLRTTGDVAQPAAGAVPGDGAGRIDSHALVFRVPAAPLYSVWEPWTPSGAGAGANIPEILEVSSVVSVFRDIPAAERAFAAWSERIPTTYRLVGHGPWRLPESAGAGAAPQLTAYGGVRPQAAVALIGTRTANVLAEVWVATPAQRRGEEDEAVTDADWAAPLQHAIGLAEVVARRTLAAVR